MKKFDKDLNNSHDVENYQETINKTRKTKILIFLIIIFSLITLNNFSTTNNTSTNIKEKSEQEVEKQEKEKIRICDGTVVTSDCTVDGIEYTTYKYYSAVPEQSHVETITTYTEEIIGYCTLCNDGTRSPTCATGRGACSHHGGVAEWNAPIYSKVPHYEEKTIIDSPGIPEHWEKIEK